MKQYYFPNEIWTIIYEYDNTYKLKYKNCINELNRHFWYIRSNSMLEWIFYFHSIAKQSPQNKLIHQISLLKYTILFFRLQVAILVFRFACEMVVSVWT